MLLVVTVAVRVPAPVIACELASENSASAPYVAPLPDTPLVVLAAVGCRMPPAAVTLLVAWLAMVSASAR